MTQNKRHEDRSVIVTGAASGIGRGIAKRFAEEGARVTVADIRKEPMAGKHFDKEVSTPTDQLLRDEYDVESQYVETDVSDRDAAKNLIDETIAKFGQIDVLVNNAGIYIPGTSEELSYDDWKEVLGVNLDGVFLTSKFAIPHIKERGGSIVNISSVHAIDGGAGPAYPSSKAGVMNLTRDQAVELGGSGARANAICPGPIGTPMQDVWSEEVLEAQKNATLVDRFGWPEDIGDAAVFLASEEASFITGQSLFVDGGFTTYRGH